MNRFFFNVENDIVCFLFYDSIFLDFILEKNKNLKEFFFSLKLTKKAI